MARRIDKAQLERVSSFRPGSCLQANVVGKMFPDGVAVEDAASLVAWQRARDTGLDLVFAACSTALPEVLVEFRDFCLVQLRLTVRGEPARVLGDEPPGSMAHKAALWYLRSQAAPVNGDSAYMVAVAARKATRALQGKETDLATRDAQLDWWERKLRRLVAGEAPPILGDREP